MSVGRTAARAGDSGWDRSSLDPLRPHPRIRRHAVRRAAAPAASLPTVHRRSRRRCSRLLARPSRCTPRGAPMPGSMRRRCARMSMSTKDIAPFRLMEALNHHLRPAPIAVLACEVKPDDWHARFSLHWPRIPLPDRQPPRAADARPQPRLANRPAARSRGDAARCAGAGRASRFHHLPLGALPVGQPGQDARPAGCRACRRGSAHPRRRAQFPASPGPLDGRLPRAGRHGAVARGADCARRSPRRIGPRWASMPRPKGFISSAPFTPASESLSCNLQRRQTRREFGREP